ncbi:hypothetical protein KY347_05550 [Candidatus Woesearchaeota archaeon]|nr:hypothetical protein [Candidatus Woesearchaeota archaeon]
MKKYKEIHIWNFPPTLIFVRLNDSFRKNLFNNFINRLGSQQKAIDFINKSARIYKLQRNHSRLNLYSWIKGGKFFNGKEKMVNVPLWILIEISKFLSISKQIDNELMWSIEKNVRFYTSLGNANSIINPKLPIIVNPEFVSVIFHFCGDGHLGNKRDCCSYKQKNKQGLANVLNKLRNSFGDFDHSRNEFENYRLNIPKTISDIYRYYFTLTSLNTFEARIPNSIKSLPKEFLLAGLCAFIVDEGNIGEVITVYSKNKPLLEDIREVTIKCGYICHDIKEKFARGKFDCYRFSISSKGCDKLYNDIVHLSKYFPTCNLAHKMEKLEKQIKFRKSKIFATSVAY